jgi:tRNA (guanine-N7-)-methyltransferase
LAGVVRLPLEQLEPYLYDIPATPALLDFTNLFGNANPVELEVGFGKGLFLLTASEDRPDTNFLGIEIERKYTLFTANRIAKRGRTNVKLVSGDARTFLPGFIPDESLAAVHVYFPDPWWKNRHRKRRLFTEEFAVQCERILKPGGRFHLVSDVEEYFHIMTAIVADRPRLEQQLEVQAKDPNHDLDYLTNFERKYRKEGRPIYRTRYVRR